MVRSEASRVYRNVVSSCAWEAKAEEEIKAKQKAKQQEALTEAAKLKPTEIIARAFHQFVSNNKGKKETNKAKKERLASGAEKDER